MSPVLVATALTVVAGAIVALAARDARVTLIGLAISLAAAALLSDPLPEPAAVAARVIGAALAAELLWIAVRETTTIARGSLVGWPAEALAAGAAFVVGAAAAGDIGPTSFAALVPAVAGAAAGSPGDGAPLIVGAALALLAVSITPLLRGRDPLRLAVAAALLLSGAATLRAGLLGTPSSLEQLVVAGLVVGVALGGAAVTMRAGGHDPTHHRPADHRPADDRPARHSRAEHRPASASGGPGPGPGPGPRPGPGR